MVHYWHRMVVCLSVTRCIVAKRLYPTSKMSEEVNRKFPFRNTILQLLVHSPHRPYPIKLRVSWTIDVACCHLANTLKTYLWLCKLSVTYRRWVRFYDVIVYNFRVTKGTMQLCFKRWVKLTAPCITGLQCVVWWRQWLCPPWCRGGG